MRAGACWILIVLFSAFAAKLASPVEAQTLSGGVVKANLDLPFDAALSKYDGDDEGAPETVTFHGQRFEADGIFYVIDRSGSMQSSGQLDIAKREIRRNIMGFSADVQFGIAVFDSVVIRFPARRRPAEATAAMKRAALNWLESVAGGGGSCCRKGLIEALNYSNASSATRKAIVYVGDGGGTCDGMNEQTYLDQTLTAVSSRNLQRALINAVGVLEIGRIQDDFLRSLTSQSGGSYVKITR